MTLYGFLIAAAFCGAAAVAEFRRRARRSGEDGQTGRGVAPLVLWLVLALLLAVLGVNRATGFLAFITDHFRTEAKTEGWYNERRALQQAWVQRTPYWGLGGFLFLLLVIRRDGLRLLPALVSLVYLVCFAVVEGISAHNMDWLLRQRLHGVQYRTWGDLVGVGLALFAVLWSAMLGYITGRSEMARRERLRS